jgi:hypothetical protein
MPNTKPVGVAFEDPYLNGALIENSTFTIPGTTFDGAILGDTGGTAGFFGTGPVAQATALTTQLTTITASAPAVPDYAIADLTDTTPFGFVSADEGQSVLTVIANLQVRVAELETKLAAYGLLA